MEARRVCVRVHRIESPGFTGISCATSRPTSGGNLRGHRKVNRTCCILFNDLFLNYTVTADLTRCTARPAHPAPPGPQRGSLVLSDMMAAFWCIFPFAVAAIGVFRKRSQSVVRMRFSPDQVSARLQGLRLLIAFRSQSQPDAFSPRLGRDCHQLCARRARARCGPHTTRHHLKCTTTQTCGAREMREEGDSLEEWGDPGSLIAPRRPESLSPRIPSGPSCALQMVSVSSPEFREEAGLRGFPSGSGLARPAP